MPICIRCNRATHQDDMQPRRRHCRSCQRMADRMSYYRRRFAKLEKVSRRRAAAYGCTVEPVDYEAIYTTQIGMDCPCCGYPLAIDSVEFDHAQPLAEGGAHAADNIRLVHRTCNREASMRRFILSKLLNRLV